MSTTLIFIYFPKYRISCEQAAMTNNFTQCNSDGTYKSKQCDENEYI
jgi:hypothetical protein